MPALDIVSPCTGVCKLDEDTGWCLGCARSGDEIADWRTTSARGRSAVWDAIPSRLSQLGVSCQRLPWTTDDIRYFALETLERAAGTWVMGVSGAVAEFAAATGEAVDVETTADVVSARTKGGALRMRLDDSVRALTFDGPATPLSERRIVLAVKRERGRLPAKDVLTDLGADPTPAISADAGKLFDLGLGRKEARFCVRIGTGDAGPVLERLCGRPFMQIMPQIGPLLIRESPTRVVETALGRLEVEGAIPGPGETSPDGPHTHLLPEYLATKRALPVGMDLPRAYVPGAIFYPKRQAG